jgi:hypothetical protein
MVKCSESIVLDGEIVVLNKEGGPDFQMHQKRMNLESQRGIEFLSTNEKKRKGRSLNIIQKASRL